MEYKKEIVKFVREALDLQESVSLDLSPLKGRGSDRTFFRLKWNRKDSAILIHYDPRRSENLYYAGIAGFLRDINIPVPQLIHHDPTRCLILMEDLGDMDLWSYRNAPWQTRQSLYQRTLIIAHRLHSFPGKEFPFDHVRLMDSFDSNLYRWERDYFRNLFVRNICKVELEPSFERELEAELSILADRLIGTNHCLVHRDLQSQNVMIRDGEPFLIDFQGMRFGCFFYDLGSLLCDPYVSFSSSERDELLSFYHGLWSPKNRTLNQVEGLSSNPDQDAFQTAFWEASVQRLMQALGAFGFLGLKKGLKVFLEHIPAGLRNLHDATSHVAFLPRLRELSELCQRAIGNKDHI